MCPVRAHEVLYKEELETIMVLGVAAWRTTNFREHEFLQSRTASEAGIVLTWEKEAHRVAAYRLTLNVLEPVRTGTGRVTRVTSGYRNLALNNELKRRKYSASSTSDHMTGCAADIVVNGMSNEEVASFIYGLGIEFDQLIWYQPGTGGTCHVSLRESGNRRQSMVMTSGGTRPWTPDPSHLPLKKPMNQKPEPLDFSVLGELEASDMPVFPHGGLLGTSVLK